MRPETSCRTLPSFMEERPTLSPIWKPYAETAHSLGVRATRSFLGPGRSASRVDNLARRLQKDLDELIGKAFDSLPGTGTIACVAGCDHCCRTLPVVVSPVEVFTIVHRLRDTRGAVDGDELAARVALTKEIDLSRAPSPGELPPCPLLGEDGLCMVYSSRPLACRGCVSADASACAACDAERPVPRSTAHQLGAAAMAKGMCDALDALGLASRLVDIRFGLAVALRSDEAEKRWLRGEDVFARER